MIKNLFAVLRKSKTPSSVFNPVAVEGEQRLKEARKGLASARKDYEQGKFSGHPEEMLEIIDDFELLVRNLTKAQKRGWTPSPKVISDLEHDIHMQREYMLAKSYTPAEIASELSWRHELLEDAHKGLR